MGIPSAAPSTTTTTAIPSAAPSTTTTTAIPSAAPSEPLNECYVERLNKDDPDTVEAKLLEVVCLCDDYRSNGFTWALNELSDDLETKVSRTILQTHFCC